MRTCACVCVCVCTCAWVHLCKNDDIELQPDEELLADSINMCL